jgi:hypothetical protein
MVWFKHLRQSQTIGEGIGMTPLMQLSHMPHEAFLQGLAPLQLNACPVAEDNNDLFDAKGVKPARSIQAVKKKYQRAPLTA